jgi:hypothetical protein
MEGDELAAQLGMESFVEIAPAELHTAAGLSRCC